MATTGNEEQDEAAPDNSTETQVSGDDDYFDSTCSTPYVSAPSSPGRPANAAYFFSAPASPTRFFSSSASPSPSSSLLPPLDCSNDFEFSARLPVAGSGSSSAVLATMISADELFFNGQIRPMRPLWKPQKMDPVLPEPDAGSSAASCDPAYKDGDEGASRGRDFRPKSRSLRRRTRSLSPLRSSEPEWPDFSPGAKDEVEGEEEEQKAADPPPAAAAARRSRRWMSIKEFLYRSKSEGRDYVKEKLSWSALSFSPSKEKKSTATPAPEEVGADKKKKALGGDGNGKRRTPARSPHELHYAAKRAQAEEMRKRTYLPYRQGLLGCLGFSSRSYSLVNGLAKTLHQHRHPVPSR